MSGVQITATLTGDAELNALFRIMPTHLQAWSVQPAVVKASRTIAAAIKPLTPEATGLLAQSIGIGKVKVLPQKGIVIGAAGPRRGFVVSGKRGVIFTSSKARAAKSGSEAKSGATRYAHLTEKDHKSRSGSVVAGSHWMERGFDSVKQAVQAQMQSDIAAGIMKQAAKMRR